MKPELIEIELTEPMTALQQALQQHAEATVGLAEHKESMKQLRERITELQGAIAETQGKAEKTPSMASMTISDIRALSASKSASFAELSALNAALDCASVELRNMESDERGLRLFVADAATGAWAALYREFFSTLDLNAFRELWTAAILSGLDRRSFVEELCGAESLDAEVATKLAEARGLPL